MYVCVKETEKGGDTHTYLLVGVSAEDRRIREKEICIQTPTSFKRHNEASQCT